MGRVCCKICQSCFCCTYFPSLPWLQTSSCTKTLYLLIFTLGAFLIWLSTILPKVTVNFPYCDGIETYECRNYSEFMQAYRTTIPFALFFSLMCLCTLGISSSRNTRAVIHNGFWFFKLAFVGGLLVAFVFVQYGWFDLIMMYVGLMFVSTFNVFELILLIQIMRDVTNFCLAFFWNDGSAFTKFFLTFFMFVLFICGILIATFLYILYMSCTINVVLISVNLSLSYLLSIGSTIASYYRKQLYFSLKGSILSCHVMFLTWSAITNNPQSDCNPEYGAALTSFRICNSISIISVWLGVLVAVQYFFREPKRERGNAVVYVEQRGTEFCGFWGRRRVVETVQPANPSMPPTGIVYVSTDENDDEYESVSYSWFAVHDLLLQATFYMMICFTNNYYVDWSRKPGTPVFYNSSAMWFKLVSSWVCIVTFFLADFFFDGSSRMFV